MFEAVGDLRPQSDGELFGQMGFIPTGVGAHGLYPSRDGTKLYVSNRGTHNLAGRKNGQGSVSVVDFATRKVIANWTIPGGGSPDMGNLSADGKWLWLSGRYDGVIYAFNTDDGSVKTIPVGGMPHGLTVWPQPGRYSLGHTLVTDDLRSYRAATLDLGIDHLHDRGRWKNNRAENSHQPTRRRERKMQRFKSAGSAEKFLSTHAAVYNTFNARRHLTSAQSHRVLRAAANHVARGRRGGLKMRKA